ncbi:hypothetical protein NC651_033954 [Populus alba x Populus x berolinensis]|nr:hypothetical protein NC651_033954 [Populus alba x Populus x berolinensis]
MASMQLIFEKNIYIYTVTFKGKIYVGFSVCPPHVLWRTLVHIKRVRYERKPFGISLKDIRNVGLPSSKLGSDVSPPSEHISSNGIQDSLYPVLKVCSALSSRQLHLLKLRSCMCDLASQLFCSPIRLLHGGKTSPDAKMAKLPTLPIKHDFQMAPSSNYGSTQYTYPKVATLAHDSALSSHTCALACQYFRSSLRLLHQGKTRSLIFGDNVQMAEPATMPLPCDLSFQIRGCMTGSSFNGEGISYIFKLHSWSLTCTIYDFTCVQEVHVLKISDICVALRSFGQ